MQKKKQWTHPGDCFIFPVLSILTTPFAFRHRIFQSVYPLLFWNCLLFFHWAGCLFKDCVWHSHGIWCLCDCIKQMCGLRQRWTGTNPAAAFLPDCSMPPSYLGRFRKMPPVQLKNLPPLTYAASDPLPSPPLPSTHDYVPWSITHFQTLWSFHIEKCHFLILEILKWFRSSSSASFSFITPPVLSHLAVQTNTCPSCKQ